MHAAMRETVSNYEHSTHVNRRRRSLFPSEIDNCDTDSDLGHISPLSSDYSFDGDPNCYTHKQNLDNSVLSNLDTIGDCDILGIVDDSDSEAYTPGKQLLTPATMSPLCLGPHISESKLIETPSKMSPSYRLKTPHDTSSTNSKLPKLARKSFSESSDLPSNKRKLTHHTSPQHLKKIKLDPKSSKVRTTLFPETDLSLTTKQFYSNTENMTRITNKKEMTPRSGIFPTTSRKVKPQRKTGQVNKNVGHKIRKPKQKKNFKCSGVKTASSTENAAITKFILDLKEMRKSKSASIKLIDNKENSKPIDPKPNTKQIVPAICLGKTHPEPESRKRPVSPETEPNQNKKFFKFTRSKGIVTMNQNIKMEVNQGKFTLLEKEKNSSVHNICLLTNGLPDYVSDDDDLPNTNIDNILSALNHESPQNIEVPANKIVLQAHTSVIESDNSIQLHQQPTCHANLILSPISQMCDDTSGLAINSPKRAKNLNYILDRMPNATKNTFNHTTERNTKLFPIFCGGTQVPGTQEKRMVNHVTNKKFKKLPANQMLLDAGQKRFGATQCHECNIIYHMGDPNDEAMHLHYHNSGHILKFQGWKNERVVGDFQTDGRIIQVVPGDSKIWWKKCSDLMDLINQELGCYNMEFPLNNCQVFLYIKNRTIIGSAVAIAKSVGHQLLSTSDNEADLCSEQKFPIKCGIPRIWVAHNHRRKGIATALMDTVKNNFIFGYGLAKSEIAISPPTELGKWFARKYFDTPNFYVYYI